MTRTQSIIVSALARAFGLACSSAGPSKQLLDARSAYQQAQTGKAAQLAPDKLVTAKEWLERAERQEDGSKMEQHYAYIAHRKTLTADAYAESAEARNQLADARDMKEDLLVQKAATAEKKLESMSDKRHEIETELARVRGELDTKGEVVDARTEELRKREQELLMKQQELETEKAARVEAEAKYEAAMKSLEEFAAIKEEERGLVITLSGQVLFKSAKADLLPIAMQKLQSVANALKMQDESRVIIVEGHTDSKGGDAYNQRLSQQRAQSVVTYLATQGVDASRLRAVGVGESRPIAENDSPEGRANNRRVEIIVSNDTVP